MDKMDRLEKDCETNSNENTFIRVTNKDIYTKLCDIENHVKQTNGKVRLNRWIATTALTLVILAISTFSVIFSQ